MLKIILASSLLIVPAFFPLGTVSPVRDRIYAEAHSDVDVWPDTVIPKTENMEVFLEIGEDGILHVLPLTSSSSNAHKEAWKRVQDRVRLLSQARIYEEL